MARLTWDSMSPIDTTRYLDAIQKAQAQTTAGVDQIGEAYKGYYDNLKKQNTNEILTTLNSAKTPEDLVNAQAQIAALQKRYGTGYDMDTVRNAVDERPSVLMQRQSAEMDYKDKQANLAARPYISKIQQAQLTALGMTPEQQAAFQEVVNTGASTDAIAANMGQFLTGERAYTNDNDWKEKNFNQAEKHFQQNYNMSLYQFEQKFGLEKTAQAWKMAQDAAEADRQDAALAASGGNVYIGADGSEYSTGAGGMGGASRLAAYAGQFAPLLNSSGGSMPAVIRQRIFAGESGGDYDTLYGNSQRQGGRFAGVKLSNMTLDQALEFSKAGGEYAQWSKTQKGVKPGTYATPMGAYQIVGSTLKAAAKALNIPGNTRMTPEVQDRIADYLYKTQGTKAWEGYSGPSSGGNAVRNTNTPTASTGYAPVAGIERKEFQKVRAGYQNALLEYNKKLAVADKPVNVDNVLAGLVANEKKGSWSTQDAFNIYESMRANPQLKGLTEEGIKNVYAQAKVWQNKPGVPFIGYNSQAGLDKSINNIIRDELVKDKQRKAHLNNAEHPSNEYIQKMQQAYEAKGIVLSRQQALRLVDPDRYKALYENPTIKAQQATKKQQPTKASATTDVPAYSAKPTPVVKPNSQVDNAASQPKPNVTTANRPIAKQDIVDFYVKRGKVDNVVPSAAYGKQYSAMVAQAKVEAQKQLDKQKAESEARKQAVRAANRASLDQAKKEYDQFQQRKIANERIKAEAARQAKQGATLDLGWNTPNQQQAALAIAARKAKEQEEARKRNNR